MAYSKSRYWKKGKKGYRRFKKSYNYNKPKATKTPTEAIIDKPMTDKINNQFITAGVVRFLNEVLDLLETDAKLKEIFNKHVVKENQRRPNKEEWDTVIAKLRDKQFAVI